MDLRWDHVCEERIVRNTRLMLLWYVSLSAPNVCRSTFFCCRCLVWGLVVIVSIFPLLLRYGSLLWYWDSVMVLLSDVSSVLFRMSVNFSG